MKYLPRGMKREDIHKRCRLLIQELYREEHRLRNTPRLSNVEILKVVFSHKKIGEEIDLLHAADLLMKEKENRARKPLRKGRRR